MVSVLEGVILNFKVPTFLGSAASWYSLLRFVAALCFKNGKKWASNCNLKTEFSKQGKFQDRSSVIKIDYKIPSLLFTFVFEIYTLFNWKKKYKKTLRWFYFFKCWLHLNIWSFLCACNSESTFFSPESHFTVSIYNFILIIHVYIKPLKRFFIDIARSIAFNFSGSLER